MGVSESFLFLHFIVKSHRVSGAFALRIILSFFPELFDKQTGTFGFIIRYQTLGTEIEIITKPFRILRAQGCVYAGIFQTDLILDKYGIRDRYHNSPPSDDVQCNQHKMSHYFE